MICRVGQYYTWQTLYDSYTGKVIKRNKKTRTYDEPRIKVKYSSRRNTKLLTRWFFERTLLTHYCIHLTKLDGLIKLRV